MTNNKNQSKGISFCSILTLIFVVLKLTNRIDWAWVWVLSPLWIGTLLTITIVAMVIIAVKLKNKK